MTLRVRVHPRAGREGLGGVRAGALVVRLPAPPVEGRANEALLRWLAGLFRLPPSALRLRQGARGRDKVVLLGGAAIDGVRERLAALLAERP